MLGYGAMVWCLLCLFLSDTVGAAEDGQCRVVDTKSGSKQDGEQRFFRDRPPVSYCMKIESCSTLLTTPNVDKVESRPFSVGGYNWTFSIKPNGFKDGNMWISAYVSIVDQTSDVFADIAFTVYSKTYDQYWTSLDPKTRRFNVIRSEWGEAKFMSHVDFKDTSKAYLFGKDECVFGVDISVSSIFKEWEVLSIDKRFFSPYSWTITKYSTSDEEYRDSAEFSIGGRNWFLRVYPTGTLEGEGKSLSLFLKLGNNEKLQPYEKIYVQAKLRVLNKRQAGQYVEKQINAWFDRPGGSWGHREFMPLADVRNASKGYIVGDTMEVQVQVEALSSTVYYGLSHNAQTVSST